MSVSVPLLSRLTARFPAYVVVAGSSSPRVAGLLLGLLGPAGEASGLLFHTRPAPPPY